ncbi:MAG: arsenosugar biosynthesis-associated peroxidase-like protein [Gemmatimonadota bacterium]
MSDSEHYYHAPDLGRFAELGKGSPKLWEAFSAWYGAVFAEGALSAREKALIALAVAHTVQCPYCIDAFTTASLEQGSNEQQMTEAVHVAAAIRGGATLVHGVQMRNHLERLGM